MCYRALPTVRSLFERGLHVSLNKAVPVVKFEHFLLHLLLGVNCVFGDPGAQLGDLVELSRQLDVEVF